MLYLEVIPALGLRMATPQVTIRFPPLITAEVDEMAAGQGLSRADYVRQAVISQLMAQLVEQAEQEQEITPR